LWVSNDEINAVYEFAPGASGNAAPIVTISGTNTGLFAPAAMALASDGSLWVVNHDFNDGSGDVERFAAGASGNVAPAATISGATSGVYGSLAIALTPDQKHVWVSQLPGSPVAAMREFPVTASGDVAPEATIIGAQTELQFAEGIAINAAGDLIVSNVAQDGFSGSLLTFAPTAHGDAAPLRTVVGAKTGLASPEADALDASGNIWTTDFHNESVVRHAPNARGDATPTRTIEGANTGLDSPIGIAVLSTKPSAPRGLRLKARRGHRLRVTWKPPAQTGGGLTGYQVMSRRSKHGHWKVVKQTRKRAFTTKKLAAHRRVYFKVSAINNDGVSRPSHQASKLVI
jgi:hypothetical protein